MKSAQKYTLSGPTPRAGELLHFEDGNLCNEEGRRVLHQRVWRKRHGGGSFVGFNIRIPDAPPLYLWPVQADTQRSPIRLRPKHEAWRQQDTERAVEIAEAIKRYAEALKPIPKDWLDELQDLIDANQPEE